MNEKKCGQAKHSDIMTFKYDIESLELQIHGDDDGGKGT